MSSEDHAPTAPLAERLTDLEIRLAYQDRVISALDEVVRTFALRVESLEQALTLLQASVGSAQLATGPANEPPPHY